MALVDRVIGDRRFRVVASDRDDGDVHPLHVAPGELARRQRAVTGRRWSMLDQVHGVQVRSVGARHEVTGRSVTGVGDVQVTDDIGVHIGMWAADCAVVVLAGESGRVVGAHAGWRGLAAGVLDVACDALEERAVAAALGPVVHPCCYEFSDADRTSVANGIGVDAELIAGTTDDDRPALDVPAAVANGLARRGVDLDVVGPCTGCDDRWFSHRVRSEPGRHGIVGWMERA